jgi:hypothetical protein
MKRTLSLCFAGLLLLPAQGARRVGEAEVREGANGLPCFTISEREENRSGTPDFQAITVSEGQRVLWHMAMPRERTFSVSSSMCIPYGGRVPALPQTPAAMLEAGKVYTVQVAARAGKGAAMPVRYQGWFCLAFQRSGTSRVRYINAVEHTRRGRAGCEPSVNTSRRSPA